MLATGPGSVETIDNFAEVISYTYERSINSEGVISIKVNNENLVPCLELYGDDPVLSGFFQNYYENSPEFATSGWLCMKPEQNLIV